MNGPAAPATPARRSGDVDRRAVVTAAVVLLVALVGGTVLVAAFVDPGPAERSVTVDDAGEVLAPPPQIVPEPNSGRAPEEAGDRGGWGQLGLFAVIVVAMGGIATVVVRGSRQARVNRAAWRAAAATGRDGVLDERR